MHHVQPTDVTCTQYTKPISSTLFTNLGSSEDPMVFFLISQLFDVVDYSNYLGGGGFCNYNSVIQALLASNMLDLLT
jgi:hypothetical protein